MSIVKRVSGDYTIRSVNSGNKVIIDSSELTLQGNLVVNGATTTISTTNLAITDNIIVVNSGEAGAGITLGTAGIQADRGTLNAVSIIYNESINKWTLSNDGTTFGIIPTSASGSTELSQDLTPVLGGNLDTLNYTLASSTGDMQLGGNMQLAYSGAAGTATPSTVVFYSAIPGEGESGIYVSNTVSTQQELVTKRKAIMLSIIF